MTTITIDRKFLEEVVELFDSAITARHPHEILRDIRAALAAPATAPEFPADWAQMIHYPECWDTAAYPELRDAIHEALAWSGCSVCKPATAPDELERLKTESEERLQNCVALVAENERLRRDAERYRWLAKYLVSDDESHDDAIVAATTVAELDYVTDAAMKGTP